MLDSVPKDVYADYLSLASGVFVPILLLVITLFVSFRAEKRSRQYTDALRKKDEAKAFQTQAHNALDSIFRYVQTLTQNNIKRKYFEKCSQDNLKTNDKTMQQDYLKWLTDKNLELQAEQGVIIIELASAQSRAQHVLFEEHTSELDNVINQITKVSKHPGYITEGMQKMFVEELNALMKKVEDYPNLWENS